MNRIFSVEFNWNGRSLGAGPERLTGFSLMVDGECVDELRDLIVEDVLEHVASELDALVVVEAGIRSREFLHDFQTASEHSRLVAEFT